MSSSRRWRCAQEDHVRDTVTGTLGLILAFTFVAQASRAYGVSNYKCKNSACDITAIGHRNLSGSRGVGNWYSTEKEKELGNKYAAEVEQRVDIVKDAAITGYVDLVTQRIAQNSDADMPVAVRVIRTNDSGAFTLFGGHIYLTTGLLLRLKSEGELASILARGIAHTALHSVGRLQTRAALMEAASIPSIRSSAIDIVPADNEIAILGSLKFRRLFEFDADYFGIQYLYKAGYDTSCFLNAVQSLWQPEPTRTLPKAFNPFPPLADRLKVLHQEIDDILPERPQAIVSSSEFDQFIGRLREIAPPQTAAEKNALPQLIRHDSSSE